MAAELSHLLSVDQMKHKYEKTKRTTLVLGFELLWFFVPQSEYCTCESSRSPLWIPNYEHSLVFLSYKCSLFAWSILKCTNW